MSPKTPSGKPPATVKELLQIAAKPFFFLILLIMVCAFFTHQLTGSETLEEYARANPEAAYGTPDDTTDASPVPDRSIDETAPPEERPTKPAAQNAPADSTDGADTQNTLADGTDGTNPQNTPTGGTDGANPQNVPTGGTDGANPQNALGTPDASSAYNTSKGTLFAEQDDASAIDQGETDDMNDTQTTDDRLQTETNPARTTYQPGFYYEPLTDEIKARITGISYPAEGCSVPYEALNYVGLRYIDFDGEEQTGELICNRAVAQDMVEIFYELYQNDYRIERVRLVDEYGGDDTLSMADNNTSCFNYRVVDGTTTLSKHALGCAIDVNPFYNPYVVFNRGGSGETYISPKGSEPYADRSLDFPYKIDENDLCYKLFTAHGFTWGGNWNSSKDYQHFQIVLN